MEDRFLYKQGTPPPLRHLTPAITRRRPDVSFHVHSEPQPGGGHVHGVVSIYPLLLHRQKHNC